MLKRGSQSPGPSTWPTLGHLILAAGTAIVLISAPISVEPGSLALTWQSAHGKTDGGNGGANGGGNGAAGSDHGNRGGANGHNGQGGGRGQGKEFQGLGQAIDALGGGRAFGRERHDERFEQARQRYERARGHAGPGEGGLDVDDRQVAHRFSAAETQALIEHGWRAGARDDGFRNHGERVRTMVELARRLDYGARVGALQANFGTPYENDIARLEAALADPALDAEERADLEDQLEDAIAAAKPGNGDNEDWARADLDYNKDGVVDVQDLEDLDAAADDAAESDATS